MPALGLQQHTLQWQAFSIDLVNVRSQQTPPLFDRAARFIQPHEKTKIHEATNNPGLLRDKAWRRKEASFCSSVTRHGVPRSRAMLDP